MRLRRRKVTVDTRSVAALHESTENLMKIKARDSEVKEVAQTARVLREHNHFAEQLQHIMGRHA